MMFNEKIMALGFTELADEELQNTVGGMIIPFWIQFFVHPTSSKSTYNGPWIL